MIACYITGYAQEHSPFTAAPGQRRQHVLEREDEQLRTRQHAHGMPSLLGLAVARCDAERGARVRQCVHGPPGRDGHAQARFGPAHGGLRAVAEPGRADPGVGGE